ncbi:hypothetical protein P8625_14700 [Tenacibaculum tangerinum]|uniref:Uncharacterized protein n=1 Tax=Tenacibaculum tangerinum TaxID=3038772 RepID=A0ABY8L1Z0_9FLAO|nr:hypothetical protein [Tenacibaculum tangerinum]WGH75304.1 hypothetical protein P8625_14700 [Tenacibaculum tangerinum]
MLEQDHYQKLNLKYNPFSFLNRNELLLTTVERINLTNLASEIKRNDTCFVEFIGRKGRGKSTLLNLLYTKYLPEATFIPLKTKNFTPILVTEGILIIDSFQKLSIKNKHHLLNNQKKIIVASHYSHKILLHQNKSFTKKINFNTLGVDIDLLEKIVKNKIQLASLDHQKASPKIPREFLKSLLKKHGNNLREIQLSLYELFLHPNKELYEL